MAKVTGALDVRLSDAAIARVDEKVLAEVRAELIAEGVNVADSEARAKALAIVRKSTPEDLLTNVAEAGRTARADVDALSAKVAKADAVRLMGQAALDAIHETAQRMSLDAVKIDPKVSPKDLGEAWEGIRHEGAAPKAFLVRWGRYVTVAKATLANAEAIEKGKTHTKVSPAAFMSALTSGKATQSALVEMARKGESIPTVGNRGGKGTPKTRKTAEPPALTWDTLIANMILVSEQSRKVPGEPSDTMRSEMHRLLGNIVDTLGKHGVRP